MSVVKIVEAQPLNDYIIRLKFADGVTGEVNLSHLAGKGVFTYWNEYENFTNVKIINGRWLAWSNEIDMDADSLYLKIRGETPKNLFPALREDPTYA